MIEALLSGKKASGVIPGVMQGIYEPQPIITSGDENFINTMGACVRVGDFLYIVAGSTLQGGNYANTNVLYRYNLKTFVITRMASQPKIVSFSSVWHDNGKIYCFGGIPNSGVTVSYLCIYDIASNTWTNTTKFSYLLKNTRIFVYNGRLYTVGGGLSSGGVYYRVLSCSLVDYTEINHGNFLNQAGAGYFQNEGQGVLIGSKFYCSRGGSPTSNAFMVYDVVTNTLTVLPPNPSTVNAETLVLLGDKIAVRNGNSSISLYDPVTNTWNVTPALANTSNAGNAMSAQFEYEGALWYKWLQSSDNTGRRLYKIY